MTSSSPSSSFHLSLSPVRADQQTVRLLFYTILFVSSLHCFHSISLSLSLFFFFVIEPESNSVGKSRQANKQKSTLANCYSFWQSIRRSLAWKFLALPFWPGNLFVVVFAAAAVNTLRSFAFEVASRCFHFDSESGFIHSLHFTGHWQIRTRFVHLVRD